MILLTPEEDLQTYNKITEYYDMAEDLGTRIDEDEEISIKQKQEILFPIIDEIKKLADILIESYVAHLKDRENLEKMVKVKENIDVVLQKIDFFKNKVYEVYRINDKKLND